MFAALKMLEYSVIYRPFANIGYFVDFWSRDRKNEAKSL